jgi:hypothetical protein
MWRTVTALALAVAIPGSASAGPISAAVEKAGRELALAEEEPQKQGRGRFWTGVALLAGGATLITLGTVELGDDETGPDDGEDLNDSDDGEDSDGWGNKALIGGGVAAAAFGGVLLLTGRHSSPSVSVRRDRIVVRQRLRF